MHGMWIPLVVAGISRVHFIACSLLGQEAASKLSKRAEQVRYI